MREIIIGGKPCPLHFGIRAINEMQKRDGDTLDSIVTSGNIDADKMLKIFAVGLNEGARKAGLDRRYSVDDVVDIIDDEPDKIGELVSIFNESINARVDLIAKKKMTSPSEAEILKEI